VSAELGSTMKSFQTADLFLRLPGGCLEVVLWTVEGEANKFVEPDRPPTHFDCNCKIK